MKVISQLDRKFIVCVVDATSESNESSQTSDCSKRILVLVDQHAASERVRVEGT
jgi:DNA mismatch repair ATPase MutL